MRNKKEFFGVLFSVLISVFLVGFAVYATTTIGNDVSIGDDLTVTGNSLTFANGASVSNSADAENLVLTETLIILDGKASVSGDFNIQGNDLTFGNGAALSNAADTELLTLTETLVSIVGKASVSSSFNVGTFASIGEDLSIEGGDFSVSGDATITGNDLTFGNAAVITNTDADTLTLTELLFDLNGSLDVSNDLIVGTGPLQVAHTASVAYSRLGSGTTGHTLADNDDLLITGLLEVDDVAYFDNFVSISSNAGTLAAVNESSSGLDITFTGTFANTGQNLIGVNSVLTPAGTAGNVAVAVFGKAVQGATKTVSGYLAGGEFEVEDTNAAPSEVHTLVLDSNSTVFDSNSSYIWAQTYGATEMPNLLKISGHTVASGSTIGPITVTDNQATHSIKIMVGSTAYYLLLSSVSVSVAD